MKKGSEYLIKAFSRVQKKGPEFETLCFMDDLYAYSQAGEGFIPEGNRQSLQEIYQKLVREFQKAADLAHILTRKVCRNGEGAAAAPQ